MAKVFLVSPIGIPIWDRGRKINLMEMVYICMLREKSIKESSLMVRNQVVGFISIRVVPSFKGNGRRIRKMGSGYFSIRITKSIKEIGSTGRNMEKEPITMLQVINISVSGARIRKMAKESYNTKMEQSMMDNGLMISLRIKVK